MPNYQTFVKVPGTSVYARVSIPVDNRQAAEREARFFLDEIIPHAVITVLETGKLSHE